MDHRKNKKKKINKNRIIFFIVLIVIIVGIITMISKSKNKTSATTVEEQTNTVKEITYENIQYDIIVDEQVVNIEATDTSKTSDGIWSVEHYYKLVNSETMKMYVVYCDDKAEIFNSEGESDTLTIDISNMYQDELDEYLITKEKSSSLLNLKDLLKDIVTEDFIITITGH